MSREHSPESDGTRLTQVTSTFSPGGCKVSLTSCLSQVSLSSSHRHSVSKGSDWARRIYLGMQKPEFRLVSACHEILLF